eukprot:GHVT01033086.1.p1 GENE.GHVT01033086.1~~GHVT01033086.1.p1  ORF type:complete len:295 (+),score=56.99 GHVT01033086.1:1262-2146(+)
MDVTPLMPAARRLRRLLAAAVASSSARLRDAALVARIQDALSETQYQEYQKRYVQGLEMALETQQPEFKKSEVRLEKSRLEEKASPSMRKPPPETGGEPTKAPVKLGKSATPGPKKTGAESLSHPPKTAVDGVKADAKPTGVTKKTAIASQFQATSNGIKKPAVAKPAVAKPAVAKPAVAKPAVAKPAVAKPAVAKQLPKAEATDTVGKAPAAGKTLPVAAGKKVSPVTAKPLAVKVSLSKTPAVGSAVNANAVKVPAKPVTVKVIMKQTKVPLKTNANASALVKPKGLPPKVL